MELLYHYLWKYKMFGRRLTTCDGRRVEILSAGRHNDDAGPDFSNASLRIGDESWVGNVELHLKASDWYRHGHDRDRAYDSVILHVVVVDDARIRRPGSDEEIPQLVVAVPEKFYITYTELTRDFKSVKCSRQLDSISNLAKEDWLETLAIERLHFKASRILDYYETLNADWEQTMFTVVARALGFSLNGIPFEMLAKNLPLRIIWHHSDNLMQIEALLFGQAGLLDESRYVFDDYYQQLCREYSFLARKYNLNPMRGEIWKFGRTRPQNFPTRRIATLAAALHEGVKFTSSLIEAKGDADRLRHLFSWKLKGYWGEHSEFGRSIEEGASRDALSKANVELMLINVAAPFYYAYGKLTGDYDLAERGYDLLSSLRPERNSIMTGWESAGLRADSALRSQALIHLKREYCERNRCLDCRFGYALLRSQAMPADAGLKAASSGAEATSARRKELSATFIDEG